MLKLLIALITKARLHLVAVILLVFMASPVRSSETNSPIVRAVLFASPTCSHCAYIKEEVLPPLIARYGSKLQIATVSTATQSGNELFLSACMKHGLLSLSVPLLIVGNTAMVGSNEIPQKFPELIEKCIAAGGIGWPNIPGLSTMLAANPAFAPNPLPNTQTAITAQAADASASNVAASMPQAKPSPARTAIASESNTPGQSVKAASTAVLALPSPNYQAHKSASTGLAQRTAASSEIIAPSEKTFAESRATPPTTAVKAEPSGIIDLTGGEAEAGVIDRIKRDIYGNGLAILVLTGMVLTLLASPWILKKAAIAANPAKRPRYDWVIPILALAGMGVAAYLSHVEVRQVEAVCGPVGDCNAVNQSEYAKLFGILPIGVLGLIGFLAIFAGWTLQRWGSSRISHYAAAAILGMTIFGVLFSIYLTFLEPFVIGATCMWCLSSSVIMTTLFVLALKPGRQAWSALK